MNERIKQFANEAEDYADSIVDQGGEFHPAYTRKFAELIVKECMDIAKRTGDSFGSWNPDVVVGGRGGTFCVYHNIKNWFGVEE